MSLLEMFAHRGVTFKETPLTIDSDNAARGLGVDTESFNGNDVETYIGKSASAVGGLLRDDLSPLDLSTETLETDVSTLGVGAVSAGMSSKLAGSPSQRGGKQGNLNRRQEPDTEIGRTMVLAGIDISDSSVPMPMSLEWKPLEEVVAPTSGAIALCMQDAGSAEVINRFFLMRAK